MSIVKFNITGSNDDVESIIQDYIDDLIAFDHHKQKYTPVMNAIKDLRNRYEFTCADYVEDTGEYPEPFGSCMLLYIYSPHFVKKYH